MPTVTTFDQVLSAPVVTRVISTIKTPNDRLQGFMGMLPGGPAVNPVGGHHAGWDIFDRTRAIAKGRAPGSGPSTIALQVIGHVAATIYRAHEKTMLLDERLFRTRPLGQNWGNIDLRGQRYVAAQENFLAQRFRNNREFMVSRMFRGEFQLLAEGDDWTPVDSGGNITIDFKIPSGNKSKLDMLTDGDILAATWSAAGTDVIGHILKINVAFEELHGLPLRHIWCNSTIFNYMLVNTGFKNAAGTANTVFSSYEVSQLTNVEGIPDTGFEVVFRAIPWLRWHIYDAGLDINGTFTKFFDDTHAVFLPDPSSLWAEALEGSEIVRENVLSPGAEQFGIYAWTEPTTQPAGYELLTVDNFLTALYLPKCVAYGLVSY